MSRLDNFCLLSILSYDRIYLTSRVYQKERKVENRSFCIQKPKSNYRYLASVVLLCRYVLLMNLAIAVNPAIMNGAYAHSNPDKCVMTRVRNPSRVNQQNVLNLLLVKNFFINSMLVYE